jgi:quercetin dioxygenase-like cupin family protein
VPGRPFTVDVSEAAAYWSLGELPTILATAEQTGGTFSLMEERLPRGAEPPPHVHHREDETFFLLEGDLSVRVGDETFPASPGSLVFCPREIPHLVSVESDEVRMLTLCTPGGVERLFVELGGTGPRPDAARRRPGARRRPDSHPGRVVRRRSARRLAHRTRALAFAA